MNNTVGIPMTLEDWTEYKRWLESQIQQTKTENVYIKC